MLAVLFGKHSLKVSVQQKVTVLTLLSKNKFPGLEDSGKVPEFLSHSAGFEPARGDPSRFRVYRLNRSATNAFREWPFKETSAVLIPVLKHKLRPEENEGNGTAVVHCSCTFVA